MTQLNYIHYLVFFAIFIIFVIGLFSSLKQDNNKTILGMIFSVTLISIFLAIFSVVVVDKYTKVVKLHKLKNKRILGIEKIVYTGIVRNEGEHTIGKVTFEIKLVNKGHATGNVKGGNFYKASGFFDFFAGGYNLNFKPQSITKEFIVARNLGPGEAKAFRVYFPYPPYFKSTAHFSKVWGH